MDILAVYSDSDSESEDNSTGPSYRGRTLSATEIPEAPESREASNEPSPPKRSRNAMDEDDETAPWRSPEPGHTPQGENNLNFREPPPPPRPSYSSPSTSALNTPNTEQIRPNQRIPANNSSKSLVMYSVDLEDDDQLDRSSLIEDSIRPVRSEPQLRRRSTPRESDPSHAATPDIDAHEYLEKSLMVGTPHSCTSDSPPLAMDTDRATLDQLPSAPTKPCDPALIAKFTEHFLKKANGMDFNAAIQKRKDFRNPSMYEKLIEHFDIDEIGSNFTKSVFDPHGFKTGDFYEKLAESQKTIMDKLEKKEQSNKQDLDKKSKRTKWDHPPDPENRRR